MVGAYSITSSWRLPSLALSETGLTLAEIRDISRSVVPSGRDSHNNMMDHISTSQCLVLDPAIELIGYGTNTNFFIAKQGLPQTKQRIQ